MRPVAVFYSASYTSECMRAFSKNEFFSSLFISLNDLYTDSSYMILVLALLFYVFLLFLLLFFLPLAVLLVVPCFYYLFHSTGLQHLFVFYYCSLFDLIFKVFKIILLFSVQQVSNLLRDIINNGFQTAWTFNFYSSHSSSHSNVAE